MSRKRKKLRNFSPKIHTQQNKDTTLFPLDDISHTKEIEEYYYDYLTGTYKKKHEKKKPDPPTIGFKSSYNDDFCDPYLYYDRIYRPVQFFSYNWSSGPSSEDITVARDILAKCIIHNIAAGKHTVKIEPNQKEKRLSIFFLKGDNPENIKNKVTHEKIIVKLDLESNTTVSLEEKEVLLKSGIIQANFTTPNIQHTISAIANTENIDIYLYDMVFKLFELLRTTQAYRNKTNLKIGYRNLTAKNKPIIEYIDISNFSKEIEKYQDTLEKETLSVSEEDNIKQEIAKNTAKLIINTLRNIAFSEGEYDELAINKSTYSEYHELLLQIVNDIYEADSTKQLFKIVTHFIKKFIPSILNDKTNNDKSNKKSDLNINDILYEAIRSEDSFLKGLSDAQQILLDTRGIGADSNYKDKKAILSELEENSKDSTGSTDIFDDDNERSLTCYGSKIILQSAYSKDNQFMLKKLDKDEILDFSKIEKEYLQMFVNIFKDKEINTRTTIPSKRINIKAFTTKNEDAFKFYKRKTINRKKKKKVTIIIDTSGSMGYVTRECINRYNSGNIILEPSVYSQLFIKLFSLLSQRHACEGLVILSGVDSINPISCAFPLPMKDTDIARIEGRYRAEGIESTMLCYQQALQLSDLVFIITDAQICDKPVKKSYWSKLMVNPIGIYVGQDYKKPAIKNKMESYFPRNIICASVKEAMNKILSILLEI